MKRNLVGVMAVSIAALLFAGCGGGSSVPKLTPIQKDRCAQLSRQIDGGGFDFKTTDAWRKERAALGC